MGLYDGIKDVAKVMQQADNIELYQKLLDLSALALDMQDEIAKLREENKEFKRVKDIEEDIEYHIDSFVTRKSDAKPIKYCAACWVDKKKLVPIQERMYGAYECTLCKAHIVYKSKNNS